MPHVFNSQQMNVVWRTTQSKITNFCRHVFSCYILLTKERIYEFWLILGTNRVYSERSYNSLTYSTLVNPLTTKFEFFLQLPFSTQFVPKNHEYKRICPKYHFNLGKNWPVLTYFQPQVINISLFSREGQWNSECLWFNIKCTLKNISEKY